MRFNEFLTESNVDDFLSRFQAALQKMPKEQLDDLSSAFRKAKNTKKRTTFGSRRSNVSSPARPSEPQTADPQNPQGAV